MSAFETTGKVKFAAISLAASGALVAAVTGKRIRVLSYVLVAVTKTAVKFQSSTGNVDLTGAMTCGTTSDSGGVSSGFNPAGHFQTAAGDALNLNLGTSVQVSGHLTYQEVP